MEIENISMANKLLEELQQYENKQAWSIQEVKKISSYIHTIEFLTLSENYIDEINKAYKPIIDEIKGQIKVL